MAATLMPAHYKVGDLVNVVTSDGRDYYGKIERITKNAQGRVVHIGGRVPGFQESEVAITVIDKGEWLFSDAPPRKISQENFDRYLEIRRSFQTPPAQHEVEIAREAVRNSPRAAFRAPVDYIPEDKPAFHQRVALVFDIMKKDANLDPQVIADIVNVVLHYTGREPTGEFVIDIVKAARSA